MNGDRAPRPTRVAIVGSGFGGLGAAIRLKREGVDDSLSSSALEMLAEHGATTRIRAAPAT